MVLLNGTFTLDVNTDVFIDVAQGSNMASAQMQVI